MFLDVLVFKLLLLLVYVKCDEFTVSTSYGLLRGRDFQSRYGRTVKAFSGIPFAKPPFGRRRFMDPEPPEPWSGVLEANNFKSVCVQVTYFYYPVENTTLGNEDCLYLSVYTPSIKPKKLLPVLVYIHGGGFYQGSGEVDRSPEFFMDHDIVVVMPNYRLHIFGFLSLEDATQPGNMGLKDQNMALVWIHENIANFGGDPQRVTLIGESAGSASVDHHMHSPMSTGLFHQAISVSGYTLSPWAMLTPGASRSMAITVATTFNCSTNSNEEILGCLRNLNAYDLIRKFKSSLRIDSKVPIIPFGPVWDKYSRNPFFPSNPQRTNPVPVPWLTGVSSLEGLILTGYLIRFPETMTLFSEKFDYYAPSLMFYADTASDPDKTTKEIKNFYFGNEPISNRLIKNITDMTSDAILWWPMVRSLQYHTGPHYVFYFDYVGERSFQEVFAGRRVLYGCIHGDELIYIWKNNNPILMEAPSNEQDIKFSNLFIKLLVNFITTGNPTPQGSEFVWPMWDDVDQNYIGFESSGIKHNKIFFENRMRFWSNVLS